MHTHTQKLSGFGGMIAPTPQHSPPPASVHAFLHGGEDALSCSSWSFTPTDSLRPLHHWPKFHCAWVKQKKRLSKHLGLYCEKSKDKILMASSVPLFRSQTHAFSAWASFWETRESGAGITSHLHVMPQLHHQSGLYPHLITFLLQGSGSALPGLTA